MNTKIFIAIAKRIREQVPDIKHIDLFNQQYNMPGEELPFNTPAVFIEYLNTNWMDGSAGIQTGNSAIRVHIVMSNYNDTCNIDELDDTTIDNRLNHYAITKAVHQALQYFEGCCFTGLLRSISEYDSNHDQILIEKVTYTFSECDDSAYAYRSYTQVTPELEIVRGIT